MVCDAILIERAKAGDRCARDTLILRNLPFAKRCAIDAYARRRHQCIPFLDIDDLINECVIALIAAIDNCDITKLAGRNFCWYAKLYCRNAIINSIAESFIIRIPPSTQYMWRHGRTSKRVTRDIDDLKRRQIGSRPDLADDKRLGPLEELILIEMRTECI